MEKPEVKEFDPKILQDLLPTYYKRIFPHKQFYRWISYGLSENSIFTNREFSFTLQDDVYIRYLSFENQKDLENEICDRNPFKIDIGAVMNVRPKDHRASSVTRPIQRELVFDIDMTDYDEVRTCCSEANVCIKCWKFMTIACRIIDLALREDFGFEHILWVFSGRRGLHCWVCDKTARHLNSQGRGAVSEYLQLVIGAGEESVSKVRIIDNMHHSIKRAYLIIEPLFNEICLEDQNMFGTPAKIKKLLQMIPDENNIRKVLADKFNQVAGDSKAVWKILTEHMEGLRKSGTSDAKFKNIIEEIQLALMYPRLDINVSKGFNHLLKSPFCIHPKTGKICIPFNPNSAAKFDPTTVPTINTLLDEINAYDEKYQASANEEDDKIRIKDYRKTSIRNSMFVFDQFLSKLEQSYTRKAVTVSDTSMEF